MSNAQAIHAHHVAKSNTVRYMPGMGTLDEAADDRSTLASLANSMPNEMASDLSRLIVSPAVTISVLSAVYTGGHHVRWTRGRTCPTDKI